MCYELLNMPTKGYYYNQRLLLQPNVIMTDLTHM